MALQKKGAGIMENNKMIKNDDNGKHGWPKQRRLWGAASPQSQTKNLPLTDDILHFDYSKLGAPPKKRVVGEGAASLLLFGVRIWGLGFRVPETSLKIGL